MIFASKSPYITGDSNQLFLVAWIAGPAVSVKSEFQSENSGNFTILITRTVLSIMPTLTIRELKTRHTPNQQSETVLIMQGGGSLGAYECGVFKNLTKHGIKFDIVAGTSIGAVNAAILAGSKSGHPDKDLEDFWMDVAETTTPSMLPDNARAVVSASYGALFGNPKFFSPVWQQTINNVSGYFSYALPYLYDLSLLKTTLQKYIDFTRLNSLNNPRLIVTCTDVKKGEAVVFDSMTTNIDADHLVACASYPFYGIGWIQKDGKYLWDGALLSNTALREVIDCSPKRDKNVYIINLFPHVQEALPKNLGEVWHRARDIMHTDKTDHNVRMSKVISKYLLLLKEMHDIISSVNLDHEMQKRFTKIERQYNKLAEERGAVIEDITRIERAEDSHFLFEDVDFSIATVKKLIEQGEHDCEKALAAKREEKEKANGKGK